MSVHSDEQPKNCPQNDFKNGRYSHTMVRTYPFNPSTQASAGDNLPCTNQNNSASTATESIASDTVLFRKRGSLNSENYNFSNANRSMSDCNIHPTTSFSQEKENITFNSTKNIFSPSIIEDETTYMGIRCVRINGQRFYQPLDVKQQERIQENVPNNNGTSSHNENNTNNCPASGQAKIETFATALLLQHKKSNNCDKFVEKIETPRMSGLRHHRSNYELSHGNSCNEMLNIEDENELPWARGNPQPISGKRGSIGWTTSAHKIVLSNSFGPLKSTNSFTNSYGSFYSDPLYQLQTSLNLTKLTNNPEQRAKFAKEQHKLDLLRQIEENKHQKMLEKQREWELEERERIKNERYMHRMRLEVEEERRKEQEKVLIAQQKAQRITAAQHKSIDILRNEQEKRDKSKIVERYKGSDFNNCPDAEETENANGRLEWWEKRAHWTERCKSPIIPALRAAQNLPDIQKNQTIKEKNFGNTKFEQNGKNLPFIEQTLNNKRSGLISSRSGSSSRSRSSSNFSSRSNHRERVNLQIRNQLAKELQQHNSGRSLDKDSRRRSYSRNSRHSYQSSIEEYEQQQLRQQRQLEKKWNTRPETKRFIQLCD